MRQRTGNGPGGGNDLVDVISRPCSWEIQKYAIGLRIQSHLRKGDPMALRDVVCAEHTRIPLA